MSAPGLPECQMCTSIAKATRVGVAGSNVKVAPEPPALVRGARSGRTLTPSVPANPCLGHGNCGFPCHPRCVPLEAGCWRALFREGSALRKGPQHVLETRGIPRTGAGLCFSAAMVPPAPSP
jgi:hypothetical protein